MKKISFLAGAALMLTLGFTSCNQKDNPATAEALYDVAVYDFAAAAVAEENPGNLNGSAAKGQAFYGWESESKVDSKRQDYKGYTWAEGSVLPEVCHVWRRSDRINGNIVDGGLKCPNDREMAIDGVDAGSYVEITYDAQDCEEGANKIIWASAIQTIDETTAPRCTAMVDGATAVSGETVIESGARIKVTSVTPAENGTGYIVFKVRKNMVISKILVANPKQAE